MKKRVFSAAAAAMMLLAGGLSVGAAPTVEEEQKFCGSGGYVERSESINYAWKDSSEEGHIKYDLPNYSVSADKTSCASTAGTILIAYYDRFYEDLIPNFTPYYSLGSAIVYKGPSYESTAVNDELYDRMGTDTNGAGTTFNGFQTGMHSYVSNKGFTYATSSVGTVNLEQYKASINSGKPVAIFLKTFSMLRGEIGTDTRDDIKTHYIAVPHVAVGCGYKVVKYYDSNNQLITQRTYLKVASGTFEYGISYLCLDGKSNIEHAVSVLIA